MKSGVSDPFFGIELLQTFYGADAAIIERCDDSSGHIDAVFRYDAKTLFVDYASRYDDKDKIADVILKLIIEDNYGVRETLLDAAF